MGVHQDRTRGWLLEWCSCWTLGEQKGRMMGLTVALIVGRGDGRHRVAGSGTFECEGGRGGRKDGSVGPRYELTSNLRGDSSGATGRVVEGGDGWALGGQIRQMMGLVGCSVSDRVQVPWERILHSIWLVSQSVNKRGDEEAVPEGTGSSKKLVAEDKEWWGSLEHEDVSVGASGCGKKI